MEALKQKVVEGLVSAGWDKKRKLDGIKQYSRQNFLSLHENKDMSSYGNYSDLSLIWLVVELAIIN